MYSPGLKCLIVAGFLIVVAPCLQADWQLIPEQSQVSYTTIKVFPGAEKSAAENNRFATLEGNVSEAGVATVRILLDSVATNVPIRDERMRQLVFDTAQHPLAVVSSQVPSTVLETPGVHQIDLAMQLELHGQSKAVATPVTVLNTENRILVTSLSPVLVSAEDFGLAGGVQELTKLAGLMYIPTTVPVSFSLMFGKH
jgi:polyisoprenoid-binding protein YceI